MFLSVVSKMSDGNFNRALLPHTPYQSGVKMGGAMARQRAVQKLRTLLPVWCPEWTTEQVEERVKAFEQSLL